MVEKMGSAFGAWADFDYFHSIVEYSSGHCLMTALYVSGIARSILESSMKTLNYKSK
jgi:hypothetical protein